MFIYIYSIICVYVYIPIYILWNIYLTLFNYFTLNDSVVPFPLLSSSFWHRSAFCFLEYMFSDMGPSIGPSLSNFDLIET